MDFTKCYVRDYKGIYYLYEVWSERVVSLEGIKPYDLELVLNYIQPGMEFDQVYNFFRRLTQDYILTVKDPDISWPSEFATLDDTDYLVEVLEWYLNSYEKADFSEVSYYYGKIQQFVRDLKIAIYPPQQKAIQFNVGYIKRVCEEIVEEDTKLLSIIKFDMVDVFNQIKSGCYIENVTLVLLQRLQNVLPSFYLASLKISKEDIGLKLPTQKHIYSFTLSFAFQPRSST
jgi:hypothetical protein